MSNEYVRLRGRNIHRLSLLGGGLVLVALFAMARSFAYLQGALDEYAQAKALMAWMTQHEATILASSRPPSPAVSLLEHADLMATLTPIFQAQAIALERVEPDATRVKVWARCADFDRVVGMLQHVKSAGIRVDRLQVGVDRAGGPAALSISAGFSVP